MVSLVGIVLAVMTMTVAGGIAFLAQAGGAWHVPRNPSGL